MKRAEYLKSLFDALNEGRISQDAYEAGLMNMDDFCDDEDGE